MSNIGVFAVHQENSLTAVKLDVGYEFEEFLRRKLLKIG